MRPVDTSTVCACLALAAPLQAQSPFVSLYGTENGDQFGAVVVRVGDVNGDGTDDVAVGAPLADVNLGGGLVFDSGLVTVYSGVDAAPLWSQQGGTDWDFGRAIADAGDVDGDGFDDVLVGAPDADALFGEEGAVFLLSGADGSGLFTWIGSQGGARFGQTLCVGELDGDPSSAEVAIGSPHRNLDGGPGGFLQEGAVYVYDLATGAGELALLGDDLTTAFFGFDTYDRRGWGWQIEYLGDPDGDGFGSLAVTAPYTNKTDGQFGGGSTFLPNVGLVRVFEPFADVDDPFGSTFRAGASGDLLGLYLARFEGDLLGDGLPDWAVTNLGQQSVQVYSGGFTPQFTLTGPCLDGVTALAGADDVDGDGVTDLLAGKAGGGASIGSACLYSGADGSWIDTLDGNAAGDRFGSAVAGLDMDGDGRSEVWVGARSDDTFGPDNGATYAYAPFPAGPPSTAYGCGVNPPGSLVELSGAPAVGDTWTLGVLDPTGQQPPGGFAFLAVANAPAPGFPCGVLLAELGMGPGLAPGELLLSPTPPNPVLLEGPKFYSGAPVPFALTVPNDPTYAGVAFYSQGVLVDPVDGIGLTEAREATVLP